jgi:hypothetical protein
VSSCDDMKQLRALACILLTLSIPTLPLFGREPVDESEVVRVGMTIVGAGIGLAAGSAVGLGFSLDAIDTPLSNTLLLTIPVAAAGAAAGALVGRWMADVALRHQPSPLFSVIEGAGLGLVCGAIVGGIVFPLNFVIAYPLLEVPEGYWGRFDYPQTLGLAVLAGAVWGGFFGMLAGAVAVPLISLVMGF